MQAAKYTRRPFSSEIVHQLIRNSWSENHGITSNSSLYTSSTPSPWHRADCLAKVVEMFEIL